MIAFTVILLLKKNIRKKPEKFEWNLLKLWAKFKKNKEVTLL